MLEADLQHYYALDLRTAFASIECRRLWVLVSGLPPDAAIHRDGKTWTTAHELAAQHVETSRGYMRLIAEGLGVKFRDPPPGPIRHPDRPSSGGPEDPKRMSTREEIAGFIARLRR